MSALADQGDIDNMIIMPTPLDIGDSADRLQKHLEFAIGEAMMDIGILPLVSDFYPYHQLKMGHRLTFLTCSGRLPRSTTADC